MTKKLLSPSINILNTAEEFYQAAEHIWAAGPAAHAMPLLVNYAFSAELSIKAVDAFVKGPPVAVAPGVTYPVPVDSKARTHGHRLDMMFAKLPPARQVEIEGRFLQHTGQELEPLLAECANYFEDVRYWYEGRVPPRFNLGGVRILAQGLLQAVQELGTSPP